MTRTSRWMRLVVLMVALQARAQDELTLEEPAPAKSTEPATKTAPKATNEPAGSAKRSERLASVKHPRLLVTPERLALIRQQIKVPGSHFQEAYSLMVKRCEADPKVAWDGEGYWPSFAARETAFLSLVAEDPKEKRRYAEMAAKALPDLNYVRFFGFKSPSLGHAMATFGISLAYDWAYNEWTDAERRKAETLMEYFHNHWETYQRVPEEPNEVCAYNFYGVLHGSQIVMHMAMGDDMTDPRLAKCADVLTRYLADVGRELGAHYESYGYTEYPMGFALPAAFALAQHGETRPLEAAKTHAFWTLGMFVQSFQTSYARKALIYACGYSVDDARDGGSEGFASLVLGLCPPEQLPYQLWMYDRHQGRLAKAEANRRYDEGRGNTFMALLFYPHGATAKDPTGVLPKMAVDSSGYVFFRNRWQDENDILIGLTNPTRCASGHFASIYLVLSLMAFDTVFLGSGKGKIPCFSTVLVDEKFEGREFVPGKTLVAEPTANGGYLVLDASGTYRGFGVERAQRHVLVAFSDPKEGSAILSTLDDLRSDKEHRYTWQLNVGGEGVPDTGGNDSVAGDKTDESQATNGDGKGAGIGTNDSKKVGSKPAAKPAPKSGVKKTKSSDLDSLLEGVGSSDRTRDASSTGIQEDLLTETRTEATTVAASAPPPKPPPPVFAPTIRLEEGVEDGRQFFVMHGRKGYVKGWVLAPTGATLRTGYPIRAEARGCDARLWVVMYAGMGKPVTAQVRGAGLQSVLKVAGREVSFDADKDRIRCGP